jgi:hypothetical protein
LVILWLQQFCQVNLIVRFLAKYAIGEVMDALVEPFQFSQSDFFNAYKNARSVVDYAGRGKAAAAAPVASLV